jgi:hypothetical protein
MTFDEKVLLVFDVFKSFLPGVRIKESILKDSKKISFFMNGKYSKKCHQVCIVIKEEMEKDLIKVDFIFWPRERIIKNTNYLIFSSKEEIKKEEQRWIKDKAWLVSKHIELLLLKKPIIDSILLKDFYSRRLTLSN